MLGKETADQHRRRDFDALPSVRSVVVAALPDNALSIPVVGQLDVHRPVMPGLEQGAETCRQAIAEVAITNHDQKSIL